MKQLIYWFDFVYRLLIFENFLEVLFDWQLGKYW